MDVDLNIVCRLLTKLLLDIIIKGNCSCFMGIYAHVTLNNFACLPSNAIREYLSGETPDTSKNFSTTK